MIVWKLEETMQRLGISQYALQKESGVAINTIKGMRKGETERPDTNTLNSVVNALRAKSGQDIQLHDILEWQPDPVSS
ncbi:helix-turn-helix transcriptional regulator [Deinococcus sp. Leaf326]|uniref:helix-turn-helix domain-containing protein n=1 Tax=Deinococcus sp. Leaf326 TaxID=1736338 RepID=UPI00138EFAFF|nr:helix-turn-helix transcriptional regulator [Deinococcus sp. Leaf326]